ncbi:glycoside hydrolase family 32 protein [Microlunatus sp. Gsoil 973]|uniref:glycoside hydrolase family 32 protein n=1 Tax=Microlunatus sp. Gsoil 973 TaxID=2672569 RepID=UPI0018A842AB|nr:glycoside hydrolase family 32 protein [Microlunatus sp. Gsoil 973]
MDGWVNDPNGLALIDGRYHVFFQYNGAEPRHRSITWGHASSSDLISWTYHGVALVNRPGNIDQQGCWSGCLVDDRGLPTAVYTAVRDSPAEAVVALARSEDRTLLTWRQSDHGVIGPPADRSLTETRDPYVFSYAGHRYAVQGTGGRDAEPAVLLYGCDDLDRWTELGVLLDFTDPLVRRIAASSTWECPNLFPLDGHWVLVLSCWQDGDLCSVYLIGDLEPHDAGPRFVPRSGGRVDDSSAYYAPQALVTADRVLIWGWAREVQRTETQLLEAGWAGALTFPRRLSVVEDRLVSTPVAELDRLRGDQLDAAAPITARAFEIRSDAGVRLALVDGDDHQVVVDGSGPVRVFVDGSLIEIFTAGAPPRTVRAYPRPTSVWSVRSDPASVVVTTLSLPSS